MRRRSSCSHCATARGTSGRIAVRLGPGELAVWAVIALALVFCMAIGQAWGQDELPALITADELRYDEELGVVTAIGNVEISRDERVLLADTVSYNERTDVVTATGNVSLLEPSGEVLFGDFVELTGDLQEGVVETLRVLFADGRTRMAAISGQRVEGRRTILNNAVYSPCELCQEDPQKAPLWQIRASEIEHDQEERSVTYRDARFEVLGIPVAYSPYFSHPDPTVTRKSGFLAPTFGSNGDLGFFYGQPYFWVISPDKDLTVTPVMTTDQGPYGSLRYRQLFEFGEVDLIGSATVADRERNDGSIASDEFRGHLDLRGRFDLTDIWRTNFSIQRATDDTYTRVYGFGTASRLRSNVTLEGFRGRNYTNLSGIAFQTQREDEESEEQPLVLPDLSYNFVSEPDALGGFFEVDSGVLALTRDDGRDTRRLSFRGAWSVSHIGSIGDIYDFTASLQTDGYWVDGDPTVSGGFDAGSEDSELTGRFFPQASLTWRYPWLASMEDGDSHIFEPVVQGVVAPANGNSNRIPNEDSQDFEFSDSSFLEPDRFSGVDRVDSGQRIDYGLKYNWIAQASNLAEVFLGQSYRFSGDQNFSEDSGVQTNFSDFVGRVVLQPLPEFQTSYRFRFDSTSLQARSSSILTRFGVPEFNVQVNYLFLADSRLVENEVEDREELQIAVQSQLTDTLTVRLSNLRDLEDDQNLRTRLDLTYEDECIAIRLIGERTEFEDREIEPDNSVRVQFKLKFSGL